MHDKGKCNALSHLLHILGQIFFFLIKLGTKRNRPTKYFVQC